MDINIIKSELRQIVTRYQTRLPSRDIENIEVLITAGECALAFDVLCTQLYEYDIVVSQIDHGILAKLGIEMSIDASLWDDLDIDN